MYDFSDDGDSVWRLNICFKNINNYIFSHDDSLNSLNN